MSADIGAQERGDFHPDQTLPAGFKKLVKDDYTNSGFDRGHVCNSKDRTNNRVNNDATFLMTNILPQVPGNNQGPWKRLEDFERTLAEQGNELYIIAGSALHFQLKDQIEHNTKLTPEMRDSQIAEIPKRIDAMMAADPWMKFFLTYDPAPGFFIKLRGRAAEAQH